MRPTIKKPLAAFFPALVLVLFAEASSYQLGITARTLGVSNNGEYFTKEADIGFKSGVYFQPDYFLSPYVELLYLGEKYEVLPILGIRLRPKLERWWVRPRFGVNVYPQSFQVELESTLKKIHLGVYA